MLSTWAFLIGLLAMGDTNTDPETYSMIVPDGLISAPLGASITLPCSVSPAFSVVPHKIRWYRPNKFDTPILLYENRKVQKDPSDAQYRGRVSLVGQLDQGNLSMRLENLTLADRGEYVCYVHNTVWFEEGTVSVIAEVVGTLPVFSVSSGEEDKVNVTCMSEGWSPQPTLTWTGGGGESITLYHTVYSTDEQGLVRVSSWLLHSPSESEWLSCSVGLSDQDRREGRVVPYVCTTHKGAVIGIVISVVVVLILVPIIVLLYRKEQEKQDLQKQKDVLEKELHGTRSRLLKEKEELQAELHVTRSRLLKEKEVHRDALAGLQEQISKISTSRLGKIEGRNPLQNQGDNQTVMELRRNTEELSQKMCEVTRRLEEEIKELQQVLRNRAGHSQRQAVSDKEKEDDTTLPMLQRKLNEISNCASDLEDEVSQIDHQYQIDVTRRLEQQNKDDTTLPVLQRKLNEINNCVSDLEDEVSQIDLRYQMDENRRLKQQNEEMQRNMDKIINQHKEKINEDGTGGTGTDDQTVSSTQGMQRNMNETIKQEEQDINEMQKKMDEVVPQKHQTEQDGTGGTSTDDQTVSSTQEMQKKMDEVVPQKHQTEQDGTGGTGTDDQTVSSTQANKTRGRDTGMASQQTTSSHRTLYSGYRY
ncbi:hypothetical protein ACEWY4_006100 [Coilia grayii]|uniref:Ig-like domain-containing protein n=1 Tax=Coilia grayii TaxID=363190 RepID=A0ABD1KCQ7_9TELE